ncbi:MAG TPA: hypothetical protein VL947_03105, partial [Cytophagales bacterium]|nr:hypothetical protein [Cytophagales bacterium]
MRSTSKIKSSLLVGLFLLLYGCSHTPEQLIQKINEDTRYAVSGVSEDCHYTLQYVPKEYLAAMELKGKPAAGDQAISNKVADYGKAYYFRVTMALKSGNNAMMDRVGSTQEYANKYNYLTYGMGKNLYILTAQYDTIYPASYTFQNPYIYNDKLSFLYVFGKGQLEKGKEADLVLKFKDDL